MFVKRWCRLPWEALLKNIEEERGLRWVRVAGVWAAERWRRRWREVRKFETHRGGIGRPRWWAERGKCRRGTSGARNHVSKVVSVVALGTLGGPGVLEKIESCLGPGVRAPETWQWRQAGS